MPPVLWITATFFFSTDKFSGERTGTILQNIVQFFLPNITAEDLRPVNFIIRKSGHFAEYGILALLLFRAFRRGANTPWQWSWAVNTQLIVVVCALVDEYHQSFVKSRTGSIYDSLLDTAGGFTALSLLWLNRRKRKD